MSALRVLSLENETAAREQLRRLVSLDRECELVGECESGTEAIRTVERMRPHILFANVQAPDMDAFTLPGAIGEPRPLVIFTSRCKRYAVNAFEARAFDFLMKPFERARFEKALSRAKSELARELPHAGGVTPVPQPARQTKIAVRQNDRVLLVDVEKIDWVEAADNYVQLHCGCEIYLLRQSMKDVESRLEPMGFVRTHRSAIANLDRIRELQLWFRGEYRVLLEDGTALPLTRAHREKLEQHFLLGV
jgi:two-component system LytT family response regulator